MERLSCQNSVLTSYLRQNLLAQIQEMTGIHFCLITKEFSYEPIKATSRFIYGCFYQIHRLTPLARNAVKILTIEQIWIVL